MGFVLPGFGQLHNGQWNKSIGIFLSFCLASLCFVALISLMSPLRWFSPLLGLSLASAVGLWLYGIVDACVVAWRQGSVHRERWQTVPVYTAVLLLACFIASNVILPTWPGGYIRQNLVDMFRIPSQSMTPGLLPGDFLFADKRINCQGCRRQVKHGDVVLFLYPNNRSMVFIKRIIGLPGDRITIDKKGVTRNGQSLTVSTKEQEDGSLLVVERGDSSEYQAIWSRPATTERRFKVPYGQVFVLGDNRNHSRDSRAFGTIPLADVIGVARQIWLSVDARLDIRWDRIGLQIE